MIAFDISHSHSAPMADALDAGWRPFGPSGVTQLRTGEDMGLSKFGEKDTTALRLFLLGPMRVCDGAGQKIVVRGRKAQAILALTALGPQMSRSRVWLRDKLWSLSDESRSATSLRQSLFELRRDLGPAGMAALEITPETVALRADRVWVDYIALQGNAGLFADLGLGEDAELLEGFDIGDPEFEDWLQALRLDWADQAEALSALQPVLRTRALGGGAGRRAAPVKLGLMRSVVHGADDLSAHLSDEVLERIVTNLREVMPLQVLDLRSRAASLDDVAQSAEAEFFARMRVLCVGRNVTLTFLLYRATHLALDWSQSIQCSLEELLEADSLVLLGFAAQVVDRMTRTVQASLAPQDGTGSPQLAGFAAMNLLFRLEGDALTRAMQVLDTAEAHRMDGIAPTSLPAALRSYAASFAVGENIGQLGSAKLDQLRRQIDAQLRDTPFNAVSLACLGHVIGYVFGEHDLAGQVLSRAVAQNPGQAFVWDHLALHKLYIGDYAAAPSHAKRAVRLGSYSPISYSYDTTLAMAATMAGDYRLATRAGSAALQKQPHFKAALRYQMVAQSAIGQRDAAEETRARLLRLDPDFADPEVRRLRFGLQSAPQAHPVLRLLKPLME